MSEELAYQPLGPINTVCDTSLDKCFDNIAYNMKRPNKWFHEMKVFGQPKEDIPIALIGGGPSVKNYIEEIKNFPGPVVICGSAHDYLVEQGVQAQYCVLCDPDPITADYIKKPLGNTIYLVATQCDSVVFDKLKFNAVYKWHCYNNDHDRFKQVDPTFQAIGGGCTVGLRSLSLAIMMGYKNIHFYGFDSCLGSNKEHHAYSFVSGEEVGHIFEIKLDPNSDKVYFCIGYQLAQAQHFKDFYEAYNSYMNPVFHGTGLLPDLMQIINNKIAKLKEDEKDGISN